MDKLTEIRGFKDSGMTEESIINSGWLTEAYHKALNFIFSKQSADGLWRDYNTLAGLSSVWVTGYICSLLFQSHHFSGNIFNTLRIILSRQRVNGGWSYNKKVPTDADSSAWVLMSMGSFEMIRPSMKEKAVKYLLQHQNVKSGGFSTYSERLDGIHRYINSTPQDTNGWCSEHTCVTAVILESLILNGIPVDDARLKNAFKFLLDSREQNWQWKSYWWNGHSYCTYHALKVLYSSGSLTRNDVRIIQNTLFETQNYDGGWSDNNFGKSEIFATSLNILSLLYIPSEESIMAACKGISYILEKQNEDGGWMSDAYLRIPLPFSLNPDAFKSWRMNEPGTGVIVNDFNKTFTSVTALTALKLFYDITCTHNTYK